MARDPRAEEVARLRWERRTRVAGRFYGTQTTDYGDVHDVRGGSRQRDMGRIGLALVLLIGLASMLLYVLGQAEVVPWLHMVLHAVGLVGWDTRRPGPAPVRR
jgi:hypothetical protein